MSNDTSNDDLHMLITEAVTVSENGIVIMDAQDRIVFYNPALAQYFGVPDEKILLGRTVYEAMAWMHQRNLGENVEGRSLNAWLEHFKSSYRSAPFRSFEINMVDGRWLLTTEQILRSGGAMVQCSDITRLKTTEAELTKSKLELEYLAMTDELTRLASRRHFLSCLEAEAQRAARYDHPLSVAMIDLDFFKRINDRYGHPGGDVVLRHFSTLLREQLRATDVAGRLGGEEFAVSFPETGIEDAYNVLERIRTTLAREKLDQFEAGFAYTFSCGLVSSQSIDEGPGPQLLSFADQALYRAKSSGRDRTCLYPH